MEQPVLPYTATIFSGVALSLALPSLALPPAFQCVRPINTLFSPTNLFKYFSIYLYMQPPIKFVILAEIFLVLF